jgi:hypothetical protein
MIRVKSLDDFLKSLDEEAEKRRAPRVMPCLRRRDRVPADFFKKLLYSAPCAGRRFFHAGFFRACCKFYV